MPEIDFDAIRKEDASTLAPPVETPTVALTDLPADSVPVPGNDAPDTLLEAPKPKKTVEERISSLTAKRREAERRAEAAEQRERDLLNRFAGQPKGDDPLDPSKFANLEDRDKAVREQARREAHAELQSEQAKKQVSSFWSDLEKDGKDIEDFDDVVEKLHDKDYPISVPMTDYLLNVADHKALLAKWLTENPDEAKRIFDLSPVAAAKELTKRDGLLGRTRAKPVSNAPPPPPSVKGASATSAQSIEAMSHEDIRKWAKEQQR